MSDHFNHVHWGFSDGGDLPSGKLTIKNYGPVEVVLTPDEVAALRRMFDGEA